MVSEFIIFGLLFCNSALLDYIFITLSNIAHIGYNKYFFHQLNVRMFWRHVHRLCLWAKKLTSCINGQPLSGQEKRHAFWAPPTEQREGALYMQHQAAASTDTELSELIHFTSVWQHAAGSLRHPELEELWQWKLAPLNLQKVKLSTNFTVNMWSMFWNVMLFWLYRILSFMSFLYFLNSLKCSYLI